MTPEKRQKIQAMLDDKSSTPNEKDICRKLLKDNPEDIPKRPGTSFLGEIYGDTIFELTPDMVDFMQAAMVSFYQGQKTSNRNILFNGTCENCNNLFASTIEKAVYCVLCLAAKQREAGNE